MMFRIAGKYAGVLRDAAAEFGIHTPDRIAMWLAQLAHESGGFKKISENLNYSEKGLRKTWPSRFTELEAHEYAGKAERIANKAYANRMGNGDESSGDGWRYRGRGLIQLTGRENYVRYGKWINSNLTGNPNQLCEDKEVIAKVAAAYWQNNGLNELADRGDFRIITRKINGGLNGLADRNDWLAKIRGVA